MSSQDPSICSNPRHAEIHLRRSDCESKEAEFLGGLNRQVCAALDLRKSIRQKVSLISRLALSSDPGKADWFGTVLNLSSVGMLVTTDQIQNILSKERISATILLDDIYKTRLDMRCRVCRVFSDGPLLNLGVEFFYLTPLQREVLERYLITIRPSNAS